MAIRPSDGSSRASLQDQRNPAAINETISFLYLLFRFISTLDLESYGYTNIVDTIDRNTGESTSLRSKIVRLHFIPGEQVLSAQQYACTVGTDQTADVGRSEERRVGKEGRSRRAQGR